MEVKTNQSPFALVAHNQDETAAFHKQIVDQNTGRLKIMPSSFYEKIPHLTRIAWSNLNGYYSLPTIELCALVKELIAGRSAIEIGSGYGVLGEALGIPCTDNHMQMRPDIEAMYRAARQHPIRYPKHVEKLEALDAVKKYKPQVVVASWVTQDWKNDGLEGLIGGVDEEALLEMVDCYIMIGHENTHRQKRILKKPHDVIRTPFLYSRGMDETKNVIYVWSKK